jgi:hypothetical protein
MVINIGVGVELGSALVPDAVWASTSSVRFRGAEFIIIWADATTSVGPAHSAANTAKRKHGMDHSSGGSSGNTATRKRRDKEERTIRYAAARHSPASREAHGPGVDPR